MMKIFAIGLTAAVVIVGAAVYADQQGLDPQYYGKVRTFSYPIPLHEMPLYVRKMDYKQPWCVLGDEDYDGDWLKPEQDQYPQFGEYIADKPRLTAEVIGSITAYIDYKIIEKK